MLRRIIITVVGFGLFVAGAIDASAQEYGIKGGVNLTDVKWGVEVDTKLAAAVVAGAFVRVRPLKPVELQIEALAVQQVIDFSEEGFVVKDTVTALQVPVLARYSVYSGRTIGVRALGGGAFDLVLIAREKVNDVTEDIKQTVAPWGAALVAAAEVGWTDRWAFDVRYVFGLTEIYRAEVAVALPAKQRSVQVTAAYKF